jgi:hypothetical protein
MSPDPGPAWTSNALKQWQIANLQKSVAPMLTYLHKLRDRMQRASFLPQDPLYQVVEKAYDAVQALTVKLHYLGCDHGTGNPPRED